MSACAQKANVGLLTAAARGRVGCRQFAVEWHISVHVAESEGGAAASPRHAPAHSNPVFVSDRNCGTYVRKVPTTIAFKRRMRPRKAKAAWETAARAHTWPSHFQSEGKQLVSFGMLMQKQMSALIASAVGRKHRDYGQSERRKSRHVWLVSVTLCVGA